MSVVRDLITRNRAGEPLGLPSFCTANGHVLRAVLAHAAETELPTVIEATCNQVNQEGGYTGMRPQDFMAWLSNMAGEAGASMDRLILGGDHLGPNPWKSEPAEQAMDKAKELVKLYVEAGFTKIHLDASMACRGEPNLTFEQIAERAADLCAVAERYAPDPDKLIYVIGTEVPIPGGETEEPAALDVTSVDRFRATIETHRHTFAARDLGAAWERIVSVVTQPGVDFGHSSIYPFVPEKARSLSEAILSEDGLTFEAHSTDYQSTEALSRLVENHFFFLKVGPELTFRFREAVFALIAMEAWIEPEAPSGLEEVITRRMDDSDGYWRDYYRGTEREIARLRIFSYSDRIRYYWSDPEVSEALNRLIQNLETAGLPETVVSPFFPDRAFGDIPTDPETLITKHVQRCVQRYVEAGASTRTDRPGQFRKVDAKSVR